jgi:aminomethyltransferase
MISLIKCSTNNNKSLLLSLSSKLSLRSLSNEKLVKTSFYDLHVSLGGKMVPFAGYELPVQYEKYGVKTEHIHTRSIGKAGLFDVSHMGQIKWYGKDAGKFIERLVVGDILSLKSGEGKLSLIMNENGGIVDDTVITKYDDHIYMVVNGACKYKDMEHFKKYWAKDLDVKMDYLEDRQLLALQGKGAVSVLEKLAPSLNLKTMNFMTGIDNVTVAGISGIRVTRCGYTGEDGFEISVDSKNAVALANSILKNTDVIPTGLGCRDSLRLEAGLCLYGNDLDESINPVEGALVWTIGGPKSRRRIEQGFLGADKFLNKDGSLKPITKKRVGLLGMTAPARSHTDIYDDDGKMKIGEVTSGGFGPTLNKPLAMGYVDIKHSKDESKVLF